MSVDYDILDTFSLIDYEPYWERGCRKHFKVDNCAANGNSWKQCYGENYIKNLITNYTKKTEDDIMDIVKICKSLKFEVFNLDIPTFSCDFNISIIPEYFINLTALSLKYSPVLRDENSVDLFRKKLDPIGEEYSEFGMRIPDLKKFCVLVTELSYFLSLSLQGNLVDDEMIKWLVPGLIANQTLRYLDLSSNQITERGMVKISSYLVRTTSLLTLDLSNNLIGGESAYAIGLVLKENTRLRVLKLSMNRFDDKNGSRLMKMITQNTYLEELDMASNPLLGKETVSLMTAMLKFNTVIKSIDLSHTAVVLLEDTIKNAEAHPALITLNIISSKTSPENIALMNSILIKKSIRLQLSNKNK